MFGIKQRKKKSNISVRILILSTVCVSTLTPVSHVFADPTNSNNSAGSSERLLSKKNCDQIMNDTFYLQLTSHHNDYPRAIMVRRDDNVKKGQFASDARMLPLFNEVARDPYSKAVHRKIYRLCGATNFNAHIEKDKHADVELRQMHIKPQPTDWGM